MRFLITGDCGFIGSNLAKSLVRDGHTVFGYDNNSNSFENKRVAGVEKCPILGSFLKNLDGIFHLGMASSSPMYKDNPHVIEDSIRTTLDVLELAKDNSCPVVFASSSSLYNGNPPPYNEKMEIGVTDYYTETRLFIERLFALHSKLYGTESAGLRFFSVFGPGDQYKGKYANNITQFALSYLKNEVPIIYGNGSQTRDFIHVDFVVKCMKRSFDILNSDADSFIMNVGSGKSYTFNEINKTLHNIINPGTNAKFIENPIRNYVQKTEADTAYMEEMMGFDYDRNFNKDLSDHIEYLRNWNE
jgi:UDP-glucose 4-epimerase